MSRRGTWTKDMISITHLIPGADEKVARAMLLAAIRFFRKKPKADPQFAGFQGSAKHNTEGKALSQAMMAVPGATKDLYNTVVPHVLLLWQFLAVNRDAKPEEKVDFWDAYAGHCRQARSAIERRHQRRALSARIRAEILRG